MQNHLRELWFTFLEGLEASSLKYGRLHQKSLKHQTHEQEKHKCAHSQSHVPQVLGSPQISYLKSFTSSAWFTWPQVVSRGELEEKSAWFTFFQVVAKR